MLFRRRSADARSLDVQAVQARRKLARAAVSAIEPLEKRQLLTALVNGKFTDTGTNVYEYRQGSGQAVRISVSGNITAEFIGGYVTGNTVTATDLVPAGTDTATDPRQVYLFSIYVARSDANSVITIADVPDVTTPVRPDEPFDGGPTIRIINASTGLSQTIASGVGGVYIGAMTRTDLQPDANDIPYIRSETRRFGLRPSSAGQIYAGLEVAPGNNLGKVLIGGTVTGLVDIQGSIDTFYAGNILTGDARGLTSPTGVGSESSTFGALFPNRNFYVAGNINHLLSGNSFGTNDLTTSSDGNLEDVNYKTGFQLWVHGRVGEIVAGRDTTTASALIQATIQNSTAVTGTGLAQTEVEFRGPDFNPLSSASYFDTRYVGANVAIAGQSVSDSTYNSNDSFDTAQWLGSEYSTDLKKNDVIQLTGSLNNLANADNDDNIDFYAVGLLAGQTVTFQLLDQQPGVDTTTHPRLGIFDPNDNLIASDYSNINSEARVGQTITITAKVAGSYRIAIANDGDVNFNGTVDGGESVTSAAVNPYELRVTNVGDIALGGLISNTDIAFQDDASRSLEVDRGDIGEVQADILGGILWSYTANPWYLPAGNLRSVDSSQVGILRTGRVQLESGIDFLVHGTVGLLHTYVTTGCMAFNDDTSLYPTAAGDLNTTLSTLATSGNIQLVDAAGDLGGDYLSNKSIGVIRARTIGTLTIAPVFQANVDNLGSDGTIDLIDVSGDGVDATIDMVGPAISTGANGDVRFIRLSNGATLSNDPKFGGGTPRETVYAPGVTASVRDDSGSTITIRPVNETRGSGRTNYTTSTGQVSLLLYPIRNGGSVIVNASVTAGAASTTTDPLTGVSTTTVSSGGALVTSTGNRAEISTFSTSGGSGPAITFDPFTRTYTTTAGTLAAPNNDIVFTGSAKTDVFEVTTAGGTITNLSNQTGGEIDNVTGAPNVLNFEAGSIGIASSATGEEVTGFQTLNPGYPFALPSDQNGGIRIGNIINVGDANLISAQNGVGNILANNINVVRANSDGRNARGVFDGIAGPIVSLFRGSPINTEGNIVSVAIGEGIASSGTGLVGFSGLYADGNIDRVAGSGDIRGDIIAADGAPATTTATTDVFGRTSTVSSPLFAIGTIALSGSGSIIDADILTTSNGTPGDATVDAVAGQEGQFGGQVITQGDTFGTEIPDITSITVGGNGGIIGAEIVSEDVGQITVNGFGVFDTGIFTGGPGTIAGITAAGYGIRDTFINGGATIGKLVATGNGKQIATTAYPASVRQKYSGLSYDPASGNQLDISNDIDAFLGTSKSRPKIQGVTESGIIEDTTVAAGRSLNLLQAYAIRARRTFTTIAQGTTQQIGLGEEAYPMRIDISDRIGTMTVASTIDGLELTSSGLGTLTTGSDVSHSQFNLTGSIGTIHVGGSLKGTTTINVTGTDGVLGTLWTGRSLYATVNSSQTISKVLVGTDFGSPLLSSSHSIKVFTVNGSLLAGSKVRAKQSINALTVGRNIDRGAIVTAHSIEEQNIKGTVRGQILLT